MADESHAEGMAVDGEEKEESKKEGKDDEKQPAQKDKDLLTFEGMACVSCKCKWLGDSSI